MEFLENSSYTQEAVIYRKFSTHSAEDVAVFAKGPMSYLFANTLEQSYIPHLMAYSAWYVAFRFEKSRII